VTTIPLTEQQLTEIEARIKAALHCPNAAANGRLDGQHTLTGGFTHIRCELCDYSQPRGERVEETAALVAGMRRLQAQRKYLIAQLAKRETETGRGDQALKEFLANPETVPSEACAKCKTPFDPDDTRFVDSKARYKETPYCRDCVDRCHDSNDAFHRCVICDTYETGS